MPERKANKLSLHNLTLLAGLAVLGWGATLTPRDALAQSQSSNSSHYQPTLPQAVCCCSTCSRPAASSPTANTANTANTSLTTSNGKACYTVYRCLASLQQYLPESLFYLQARADRSSPGPQVL